MTRGTSISVGAHALLFAWLFIGNVFSADPPEMQVADVSVISEAEFAALTQTTTPQPSVDPVPVQPAPPPAPDPVPEPPAPDTPPEPVEPAPPPAPEPAPEVLPETPPAPPQAEVQDAPPELAPAPEPVPQISAPIASVRPVPRPTPRVAPEPVAAPPPDATVDPDVQQAADDRADAEVEAEVEQEQTAPEEAATEIVTEAEEPAAAAPTRSLRPAARPQRVVEAAQAAQSDPTPRQEVAEATQDVSDDVNATLADLLGGADDPAPSAPVGPPLTAGERDGLRVAVQECWVVDVGSQAANVTVVLGFDMQRDGRVVAASIEMLSASGGSGSAVQTAFQAARRALLRCENGGYDLPVEKYEQWKQIEMTFNPAEMRLR